MTIFRNLVDINYQLGPNDDNGIAIDIPFAFMGKWTRLYLSNNGWISFGGNSADYRPDWRMIEQFYTGYGVRPAGSYWYGDIAFFRNAIYAYWSDVDTRSDPQGLAKLLYGFNNQYFVAEWLDVGYFFTRYDNRAKFQIILSAYGFEINYDYVQFDLGDASGYGSSYSSDWYPAIAGYSLFDAPVTPRTLIGPTYYYINNSRQLNDSLTPNQLTDSGTNALIKNSKDSGVLGRYDFNFSFTAVPALRMNQRNDGLGIKGNPRMNKNNGSSSENTGLRLKGKNTYV